MRKAIEILAWSVGAALLVAYAITRVTSERQSNAALRSFERTQRTFIATNDPSAGQSPLHAGDADVSLWSSMRVAAYRTASTTSRNLPLAILRIPELGLAVPIFSGTGAASLDRGAGHIEGTAMPGTLGNVGVAAHRDGFFRVLKDARVGHTIYLELVDKTLEYRISKLHLVDSTEVSVLADHGVPRLTLVTCYPFYFVGPAPKRFIVHADATVAPSNQGTSDALPFCDIISFDRCCISGSCETPGRQGSR